jgi:hypothetical protein
MRVAHIRLQRFRGYEEAEFFFDGSVVLAGEPRAGRTDLIEALRRVLDPRSTSSRVNPLDIHRPTSDDPNTLTEVEVTLLDLRSELTALLSEYLEPIDPDTGMPATSGRANVAELGMRMCYRARYDFDSDTGDHWVDCPGFSDVGAGLIRRVRRADREALPVRFVESQPPLQVRAEGAFRQLLADENASALGTALDELGEAVAAATEAFSRTAVVSTGITNVLTSGPDVLLGLDDPAAVEFVPDDGSLAGLLRTLQPAAVLDAAGPLPLRSHGSTTQGVMAVAESIAAARRTEAALVVLGDDFGDGLDAPSAEHAALTLRQAAAQTILTTRRPDVLRAFDAEQLIRLTRSHGTRQQHRLEKADKAGRLIRMLVLDRLVSAITSRTVVLVEGPFDADGYRALATRLAHKAGAKYSLAAHGIRLVSPPGSDGGITRLPGMARVATELGFHVKAIVDHDKPGALEPKVRELMDEAEAVVVLPTRCAVEAALVRGLAPAKVREAVDLLTSSGDLPPLPAMPDEDLSDYLVDKKVIKNLRLHEAWARSVTVRPPIATAAIELICSDKTGQLDVPDAP